MKTETILSQLFLKPTKGAKEKVKQLIDILKTFKSLELELIDRKIEIYSFGKIDKLYFPSHWSDKAEIWNVESGKNMECEIFTFKSKFGTYKNTVPTNCDLHFEFCKMLNVEIRVNQLMVA